MRVTFHFFPLSLCVCVCDVLECVYICVYVRVCVHACAPVCVRERESGRAGQGKEIFTGAKHKTEQEIKSGKDEK